MVPNSFAHTENHNSSISMYTSLLGVEYFCICTSANMGNQILFLLLCSCSYYFVDSHTWSRFL